MFNICMVCGGLLLSAEFAYELPLNSQDLHNTPQQLAPILFSIPTYRVSQKKHSDV